MWKHLNHPNIVPFIGVTFEPLQLVSEWVTRGELREYVNNNHQTNPINLVSATSSRPQQSLHPALSYSVLPKVSTTFTHIT